MGIVEMLMGRRNGNDGKYTCWMCDESYAQPGEFLAHIKECRSRHNAQKTETEAAVQR